MINTGPGFRRLIRAACGLYWIGIFTLTHLPPSELPKTHVSDKLAHFTIFFGLATLLHLSLRPIRWSLVKHGIMVIMILLAYGAFDELTQPIFDRTCDIHDWYADASGTLAAVVMMSVSHLIAAKQRGFELRTSKPPQP